MNRIDISRADALCRAAFPEDGPGASVLLLQGDGILFDAGYGCADVRTKVPVNGDTFFNIASISKQFTAVAVLQLVERGLVSLQDSVHKWFPEFESDIWDRITVAHLLSHSSGVPDGRGYMTREEKILCDDVKTCEFMRTLDHLNFEPGTAYEYMNPTFTLCGHLVSRASGTEFSDYMRKHVLQPAGMRETVYFDPAHQERIPRMAHAFQRTETGWELNEYGQETCFATRPDGGLYTSAHEFVLWEKALRKNILLLRETLALAHTPHTLVTGSSHSSYQNRPNTWYGYGWFIEPPRVIYHTGDNGGFKALAVRYPETESLLLVFAARNDWDRTAFRYAFEEAAALR